MGEKYQVLLSVIVHRFVFCLFFTLFLDLFAIGSQFNFEVNDFSLPFWNGMSSLYLFILALELVYATSR